MKINKPKVLFYLSYDSLLEPLGLSQIVPYVSKISNEYLIEIISFEKKNNFNKNN